MKYENEPAKDASSRWTLHAFVHRAPNLTTEKRLTKYLANNYRQIGVDGRPVFNASTPLSVTISFSLIQILQFDPAQKVISLIGWINLVRLRFGLREISIQHIVIEFNLWQTKIACENQ